MVRAAQIRFEAEFQSTMDIVAIAFVCVTELTKTILLYIFCNHIVHALEPLTYLTW
ncbi:protein of unknown function [Methylotuvimicrobium alcaliphilum 20Z]|uniref:Uncharacterized protein n=1 Tax=Methylotuvimicrobium alcaliphilum (strain DSM 19304 / NCIMB 14124 / VKM B-2133 / 20Z) TaxID=1091494 RepID=G4SX78_META2|nr:protein of unknown function [Methylotuvimicrobium alcaliphilum 20Z]